MTGIEQMLRAENRELKLQLTKHQRTILGQSETVMALRLALSGLAEELARDKATIEALNRQIAALGRVVEGKTTAASDTPRIGGDW